jgi:hypothetical protein
MESMAHSLPCVDTAIDTWQRKENRPMLQKLTASTQIDQRSAEAFLTMVQTRYGSLDAWFKHQVEREIQVSPEARSALEHVMSRDAEVIEKLGRS